MEVQNRRNFKAESESPVDQKINFKAESESPVDQKGISPERNAAADDDNRSIGEGEIIVEGRVGESAGVEMISKKKRRGRPRKYAAVDREKPLPVSPQRSFSSSSDSQIISKRRLRRPPGRGRLQFLASLGGFAWDSVNGSFTPHVIHIAAGEDIVNRISTFSSKGPGAICILSAVGLISSVILHQPAGSKDSILRFEGMFEILRLSGSFIGEMNQKHIKGGHISISLAKPDGLVFGGLVASSLIAASPIQVVVGSFKQKFSSAVKSGHNSQPSGTEEEEICDAPSSPH